MQVFRTVAVLALLTGPVCAQTLIQSFDQKTPQQKADEELREKFSKEQQSHQQVPEAAPKTSVDAWGNVRTGDAAKSAASKTAAAKATTPKTSGSTAKTVTSVKPSNKTGTDAD
jgi:alpha-beta hydrolase superfamily lysophospholipase